MAVAIMAGLVVATVLTVLGVPAIYAAWYRLRDPARSNGKNTPADQESRA
jgi:hypothetical protein